MDEVMVSVAVDEVAVVSVPVVVVDDVMVVEAVKVPVVVDKDVVVVSVSVMLVAQTLQYVSHMWA
jgi:hypothetical protein